MEFITTNDITLDFNIYTIRVTLDSVSEETESNIQKALNSLQELGLVITNLQNIEVSYADLTWSAYMWEQDGKIEFSLLPPVGRLCTDCKNCYCSRVGTPDQVTCLDSCINFTSEEEEEEEEEDEGFWW